ncbi:complex I subunit 5 family protein [Natranaerobius thermophilus]|uniref:Proton-translocating NADH-quinone oxidoreductase, chain M n=1 Tax=Natranaerobius thermophilus (strain ATCC BAA-1301 / DSM 18059 / JW/NM-WN-LF) TaxID=457570 RepID=B2A693_NATTJ|nr:monovalent cation/H+ antiporter subunit D family protein [Natranaerobius thermophilus]ACB84104.1 proton-translocating NADH-quinone oxidoreductase, chain M [Natranaerobius thermophilus JW/NM-WN-LF]
MEGHFHLPIIIVLIGIFVSFILPGLHFIKKNLNEYVSLSAMILMLVIAIYLVIEVSSNGPFTYVVGEWAPPWGIEFNVDYLGVYMTLIITGIGFLALLYASRDLHHELQENALSLYYPLYMLLMASMIGMVLTNDIFNLFVLLEITLLTSVAIICVKENKDTIEASLKYLMLNALGSATVLMGIALLYIITGHLNMTYIAQELAVNFEQYPTVIMAIVALFFVGFGVKSALFPMHVWLPDAHGSAPSPSSAVLSGLVIKVYVVSLIRFYFIVLPEEILELMPVGEILLWFAAAGMILGSMFAIAQEDIKKMLAYSSVAQISYVFLGIGLLSLTSFQGGLLHILNHAIIKSMLFLIAGAIIYTSGIRKISHMHGVGLRYPLIMICFTLGAFAMIGIPGTNGFISKWYLALGALDAGRPFFVLVILVSSLLNGVYYLPIVVNSFFGDMQDADINFIKCNKLPWQMFFPIVLCGFLIIFIGLYPALPLSLVEPAVEFLMPEL